MINSVNCLEQALTALMQVRCRRKYLSFLWRPGLCIDMGDMRGGHSDLPGILS